ncbi:lactosylceramide 4-alpha-galactosyltransferase-like [Dermacentor andersoni]|uniref:lactosylceramide 4-alpha-galactosyltransferase-like n=1 Tax=Dermacentor andersoni TaxID=34620 RepID=UPI002416C342|nr:lactosylceramide 4-alpha-galactosyltransferase-like [Dermacentor andersoni]
MRFSFYFVPGISHFTLSSKQRFLQHQSIASYDAFQASDVTIWFVESSNETNLKGRQACSIESASLHNPNVRVLLLTTGHLSPNCEFYKALSSLRNFASLKLNLTDTFSDTPLDSWHRSRNWTKGLYGIEDLSDGIRLAVLWKHGGIYLDLDIIVLKELSELSNSVMFEVTGQLTNSVLCFDKAHPFIGEALKRCSEEYDTVRWGSCGPSLLGRIYHSWRNARKVVRFRERDTFFAVGYDTWMSFFEPSKTGWVFETVSNSYGVHLWNKLSHGVRVVVGSGSALDVLARFNCPTVYKVIKSKQFF